MFWYFHWVSYHGHTSFIEWVKKCYFFFWKKLYRNDVNSPLNIWFRNSPAKPCTPKNWGEVYNYEFTILIIIRLFKLYYVSCYNSYCWVYICLVFCTCIWASSSVLTIEVQDGNCSLQAHCGPQPCAGAGGSICNWWRGSFLWGFHPTSASKPLLNPGPHGC